MVVCRFSRCDRARNHSLHFKHGPILSADTHVRHDSRDGAQCSQREAEDCRRRCEDGLTVSSRSSPGTALVRCHLVDPASSHMLVSK